ncbi:MULTISPECIES: hypothetical protein [Lysobacter]|uniref:hypothetical protein n=1 Tax=Lysobacter TaxID=68 RepID=UPI001F381142|nr:MULTISPECIES: hypothetical protein [Lysobacter]UJB17726.1 hypothetical protein L1A79_15275 [Lysobacter capsici]UJQ28552.1 hypothetical protein L2D09_24615 [Lysobacter gummosus]
MKSAMWAGVLSVTLSFAPSGAIAAEATTKTPDESAISPERAIQVFALARTLCERDAGKLWGASLCAPIMLVEPKTRVILASQADADGALKARGAVFVGSLPAKDNAANTATHWSGTHWTQLVWPLPEDEARRSVLIAHELFHRLHPQLRIAAVEGGDNAHLDTFEGRYALQLEWRALATALQADVAQAQRLAIDDALAFRADRYRRFPKAANDETALELNEGLAEYTGVMVGEATSERRLQAALHDLRVHVGDPSFVRSFAYATGPAYGLLLDRRAPGWRERLATPASLYALLSATVNVDETAGAQTLDQRATRYGGAALRESEQARELARQRVSADNLRRFVDGPVLRVPLQHMNIQFDPRNLQALGEHGTVYPGLRISDDWGTLEVSEGALMKPDWRTLVLVAPSKKTRGNEVAGAGWKLQLKSGWELAAGDRAGDRVLKRVAK